MKVRAVIDLMGGVVVRGIGGKREQYRPIKSQLTRSIHPKDIANAIHNATGIDDFYIADLDAIQRDACPDWPLAAWFTANGWSLWIDCGIVTAAEVAALPDVGARPVIGTETFHDEPGKLKSGPKDTLVLSLDTLAGNLLGAGSRRFADAASAWKAWRTVGVVDLILMDLARVGSYLGPIGSSAKDPEVAPCLYEGARLHAAGGVRHTQDLKELEAAGYHSALVASAIHDGRIFPAKKSPYLE